MTLAPPSAVTLPPSVAPVAVSDALVGAVTVGGARRVTVTVYVVCVTPSCAVTRTSTGFVPRFNVSAPLAAPLVTGAYVPPFTRTSIVACACVAVGVTVSDVTPVATLAV